MVLFFSFSRSDQPYLGEMDFHSLLGHAVFHEPFGLRSVFHASAASAQSFGFTSSAVGGTGFPINAFEKEFRIFHFRTVID